MRGEAEFSACALCSLKSNLEKPDPLLCTPLFPSIMRGGCDAQIRPHHAQVRLLTSPRYLESIWKGPLLQTSLGSIWQKQKQFTGSSQGSCNFPLSAVMTFLSAHQETCPQHTHQLEVVPHFPAPQGSPQSAVARGWPQ